jgi:hypothetical protein
MVLRFNERRATEAAARFLKLRGGRMSYLKLIKSKRQRKPSVLVVSLVMK